MIDRVTQTAAAIAAAGVFVVVLAGLTVAGGALNRKELRR